MGTIRVKMDEYKRLIQKLNITLQITSGTGGRGQCYVDAAYEKLKNHCVAHGISIDTGRPIVSGDGNDGLSSGLACMIQVLGKSDP